MSHSKEGVRVITGTGVPVGDVRGVDCSLGEDTEAGTSSSSWRVMNWWSKLEITQSWVFFTLHFVSGLLHPLSADVILAW